MKAVVGLEVAQPVDHVEHCEAEGEEGAGNFVDFRRRVDNNAATGGVLFSQLPEVLVGEETEAKLSKKGRTGLRLNPTVPCSTGQCCLGPQPPRQRWRRRSSGRDWGRLFRIPVAAAL